MKNQEFSALDLDIFSDLSPKDAIDIAPDLNFKSYRRGETVFRSGDLADRFYILATGRMKIYFLQADGREQILYIYGADDFVGGFNLLHNDAYVYTAEALEDSIIANLNKDAFDRFMISHPQLTIKILNKAYERIRWAEALVSRLVYQDADAKVAKLLLDLIMRFGEQSKEGILLRLTITREEMGSFTGLSRESVARRLSYFAQRKIIKLIDTRTILLLDLEELRNICSLED